MNFTSLIMKVFLKSVSKIRDGLFYTKDVTKKKKSLRFLSDPSPDSIVQLLLPVEQLLYELSSGISRDRPGLFEL